MGSINSALLSKQGPRPIALDAKANPLPAAHVPAEEIPQIQIPSRAGPGPGAVNAPSHLPQPRNMFEEYIEISSSSSASSAGEDDQKAEPVPPQRPSFRLPRLQGLQSLLSREPSSPSSTGLAANRIVQPAAHAPASFARDISPVNPILRQYIDMYGEEMNLDNHFDDFDALDIQDAELAQVMEQEFRAQMVARRHDDNELFAANQQVIDPAPSKASTKEAAIDKVVTVFPDICVGHVLNLYDSIAQDPERVVAHILDNMDNGKPYPKARDTENLRKRKRELDKDEEAALKYSAADRLAKIAPVIQRFVRTILSAEFPETPMTFVDACLRQNGHRLFSTYRVLEEAERTFSVENPPYNKIRSKRKMPEEYRHDNLATFITTISYDQQRVDMLQELQVARRIRKNAESKREEERQLQLAEEANLLKAKADGTMLDCQCCYVDHPMNRMVHCDNEGDLHWFCKGCAKRNAETIIGLSKYQLVCMAMEGCTASFSIAQRSLFLDDKMVIALERNEQEANLRMAGIENLASCPFCPYAAEYPPVEIDKEFRCEAPECKKVSCRSCKLESHIPKSCEENTKDTGLSVRRQVEEAMSEALIRKCNKCSTPFVKEDGCNKMTCTRAGCRNVQCYVCSQSCTYSHFNDERRGGKAGNCPLFEKTSQRHEDEVKRAEKEALGKIRAEHPEYTEEELTIGVSDAVLEDEQRRRTNEIVPRQAAAPAYAGPGNLAAYGAGYHQLQNMANNAMQNGVAGARHQLPRAGDIAMDGPPRGNIYNMALPNAVEKQPPPQHNPRLGPIRAPDIPFLYGPPLAARRGHVLHPVQERPEPPVYEPPAPHQRIGDIFGPNNNIDNVWYQAEAHFINLLNANGNNFPARQAKPQAEQGQPNFDRQPNQFPEPPAMRYQSQVGQRLQRANRLKMLAQLENAAAAKGGGRRINEPGRNMAPNQQNGQ